MNEKPDPDQTPEPTSAEPTGRQPSSSEPPSAGHPTPDAGPSLDLPGPKEAQVRPPAPTQADRWSTETEGPSPTARADALGATVLAYLITGPVVFGGLGYGLDRLLGTGFLVVVGILAGMALSLYVIWLRYGTS